MSDPLNKKKASRGRPFQYETMKMYTVRLRDPHIAWLRSNPANVDELRAWLESKIPADQRKPTQ